MALTNAQQAAYYYAHKRRKMRAAQIDAATPLTVEEASANGTAVGSVRMLPQFGRPTFSLTDDANGRFEIDAATGEISVADGTQLVFANDESHDIVVQATDNSRNTFTKTLTVQVTEA